MTQVLLTNDLSIFKKHPNQRDLDPANIRRLTASIKTKNMMQFRPIMVNNQMEVLDGGHRLEVAKILNLPVYYQIQENSTSEDMLLLNFAQKRWTNLDYIKYHASKGHRGFISILEIAEKTKFSPAIIYDAFPFGETKKRSILKSTSDLDLFTEENIEIVKATLAKTSKIINYQKEILMTNSKWINSFRSIQALFNLIKNPSFDVDVFIKKIGLKANVLRACATVQGYYEMYRDIYNWKNANPID